MDKHGLWLQKRKAVWITGAKCKNHLDDKMNQRGGLIFDRSPDARNTTFVMNIESGEHEPTILALAKEKSSCTGSFLVCVQINRLPCLQHLRSTLHEARGRSHQNLNPNSHKSLTRVKNGGSSYTTFRKQVGFSFEYNTILFL